MPSQARSEDSSGALLLCTCLHLEAFLALPSNFLALSQLSVGDKHISQILWQLRFGIFFNCLCAVTSFLALLSYAIGQCLFDHASIDPSINEKQFDREEL